MYDVKSLLKFKYFLLDMHLHSYMIKEYLRLGAYLTDLKLFLTLTHYNYI